MKQTMYLKLKGYIIAILFQDNVVAKNDDDVEALEMETDIEHLIVYFFIKILIAS